MNTKDIHECKIQSKELCSNWMPDSASSSCCPLEALVEPVAKTQALKVDAKVTCSRLWLKQWPKLKL